ncbi:YiiX/YebB-like N1pC/P60 family cysteine hydrolase [Priestia megaterium]|uniref:YiiX/YebB-like N1pC/P60 family cysteine hydrolase n=1 Tax=Priestia megaterium TaxID=1404 RepID=UPI003D028BA7
MKAGDIVFVKGDTFISKTVRFFDKGDFSHVAMALSSSHIIEAQYNSRVRIKPLDYENIEVFEMNMNISQRHTLLQNAVNSTGKWYDYLQIIGFILAPNRRVGSPKQFICSELVHALLEGVGIEVGDEFTTPNQLYRLLHERRSRMI